MTPQPRKSRGRKPRRLSFKCLLGKHDEDYVLVRDCELWAVRITFCRRCGKTMTAMASRQD